MGGLYRTMANTIIVRLEKPGPESHSYKFYLKLALNDGKYGKLNTTYNFHVSGWI